MKKTEMLLASALALPAADNTAAEEQYIQNLGHVGDYYNEQTVVHGIRAQMPPGATHFKIQFEGDNAQDVVDYPPGIDGSGKGNISCIPEGGGQSIQATDHPTDTWISLEGDYLRIDNCTTLTPNTQITFLAGQQLPTEEPPTEEQVNPSWSETYEVELGILGGSQKRYPTNKAYWDLAELPPQDLSVTLEAANDPNNPYRIRLARIFEDPENPGQEVHERILMTQGVHPVSVEKYPVDYEPLLEVMAKRQAPPEEIDAAKACWKDKREYWKEWLKGANEADVAACNAERDEERAAAQDSFQATKAECIRVRDEKKAAAQEEFKEGVAECNAGRDEKKAACGKDEDCKTEANNEAKQCRDDAKGVKQGEINNANQKAQECRNDAKGVKQGEINNANQKAQECRNDAKIENKMQKQAGLDDSWVECNQPVSVTVTISGNGGEPPLEIIDYQE
jgi:hypothetical protein